MTRPGNLSTLALMSLIGATALHPLNSTILGVILPEIGAEFSANSAVLTALIVAPYLIVGIAFQSVSGRVGDAWGYGRAVQVGQLLFLAGSATAGLAPSLMFVAVGRLLMAIGGALILPASMALVQTKTDPLHRVRTFVIIDSAFSVSAAAGPLFGGLLAASYGWRLAFAANIPLLLFGLWTGRHLKDPDHVPKPLRVDWVGITLLPIALTALVFGVKSAEGPSVPLIGVAAVFGIAFTWWERRAAAPLVDFSLLRNRGYITGTLLIALPSIGLYTLMYCLPLVTSEIGALGADSIGVAMSIFWVAITLSTAAAARLSKTLSMRTIIGAGVLLGFVGLYLVSMRSALSSFTLLTSGLVLFGTSYGVALIARSSALGGVPKSQVGLAGGMMKMVQSAAGLIGVTVVAFVLKTQHEDIVPPYRWVLGVCALGLVGSVMALAAVTSPRK